MEYLRFCCRGRRLQSSLHFSMHGVGVDVGVVGIRALLVHEPVQHSCNVSHVRLRRPPHRCRTAHGVIAVALAWLV